MNKADIVLIKFPFTDFSGSKLRPALVLVSSKEDITVAFVTTNLKEVDSSSLLLKAGKSNGLKKDSLLKLNKLATLDLDLVMGRIGNLTETELLEVDKKLIEVFKINIKNLTEQNKDKQIK